MDYHSWLRSSALTLAHPLPLRMTLQQSHLSGVYHPYQHQQPYTPQTQQLYQDVPLQTSKLEIETQTSPHQQFNYQLERNCPIMIGDVDYL
ncbi:hypothetical protein V6N13_033961 [Hibiscus sabdariffa]|uniref:Uncharacterized protein n=1 Tax=Hibiscus sabdariffa TaxID=183260 RepID=A0ABR2F903_9ROSI